MEFEEIRPYHDEELPQVFEELIADPAFQQVACAVMPGVPFEAIAQKMRASKTKQEFQENLCYGILHKLAKDTTDGLILESMAVLKQTVGLYLCLQSSGHYSRLRFFVCSPGGAGTGHRGNRYR